MHLECFVLVGIARSKIIFMISASALAHMGVRRCSLVLYFVLVGVFLNNVIGLATISLLTAAQTPPKTRLKARIDFWLIFGRFCFELLMFFC